MRFPVLDRSDAEALGRDDPGAVWPERHQAAANVGTGAEVVQIGRRSTAWYSGADVTAARRSLRARADAAAATIARGAVAEVLDGRRGRAGGRRGRDRHPVRRPRPGGGRGRRRWPTSSARATVGDTVTYVVNRNINYTNVCTFKCTFCGFSKGPLSLNLRGSAVPARPSTTSPSATAEACRARRDRGVPAGRHPPELRRRLLRRRRPGGEGRRAGHPRPRLHRAGGHRGRQAARRAARRRT